MQALQFWKAVALDEANMLESLVGFLEEERVAYQARDMAVLRGSLGSAPVVLSSATPSIESLVNAEQGRYRHIRIGTRYKAATLPALQAIDKNLSRQVAEAFPQLREQIEKNPPAHFPERSR